MEMKRAIERVTIILSEYKQNQQYLNADYTMVPEEDLNRWKQENEEGIEALAEALRIMKEHEEAQTITGINQVAREIHENAAEPEQYSLNVDPATGEIVEEESEVADNA